MYKPCADTNICNKKCLILKVKSHSFKNCIKCSQKSFNEWGMLIMENLMHNKVFQNNDFLKGGKLHSEEGGKEPSSDAKGAKKLMCIKFSISFGKKK